MKVKKFPHRLLVCSSLLIGILGTTVAEEGRVTGRVHTPEGAPAIDARIVLIELRLSTHVDENGVFEFRNVAPGDYHVQAISSRFGSHVQEIRVDASGEATVDITLDLSAHRERVVVTASRTGRGSAEVVQPVTVLDSAQLAESMQPTLGETLSEQPGVSSTYFGPGSSRPIVRGQSGGRVRVLEGGLGVGDASTTSPDHAVGLDPFGAESVEILRGPSTLLYGGNAVGGVINVIDDRIPEYAPKKRLSGAFDLLYGSAAEERSGALSLNGGVRQFAWHVDGFSRETSDYAIPGRAVAGDPSSAAGRLPNSALESDGGALGLSWVGSTGFVGVAGKRFDTRYGIPDADEPVRIDLEQERYELRGGFDFNAGALTGMRFSAGIADYQHIELEDNAVGTTFLNDGDEARIELTHGRNGPLKGVFGVQYQGRQVEAIGDEAFIPANESELLAAFVVQELDRGPLRYEFGARFDRQELSTRTAAAAEPLCLDPRPREFDNLSGSFGAVYLSQAGYAVGGSLSRSVRAPSAEELYSCGEHVATLSFEVGDPTLDEENSLGLDLNFRKRTGRLTGEINLFNYSYEDYIFEFDTGTLEPSGDPAGLPVFRFAQADADFYGAELSGAIELIHGEVRDFDLTFQGDVVRAELSDGTPLPRIPPLSFATGLGFRGVHWHAAADVHWFDNQSRSAPSESKSSGYTLVSAHVGYRFITRSAVHDITLRGANLTDEEARPHTSRLKDSVPLPGVDVGLVYRLIF